MIFLLVILANAIFYLWIFIKSVETTSMFKYVEPKELTEGDWIAKDYKVDGKYICGPKDLGIEKRQIRLFPSRLQKPTAGLSSHWH